MGETARLHSKRAHVAGALCYIIGPLALLIERKDARVRFHAFQALLLGASVAVFDLSLEIIHAVSYRYSWEAGLQATAVFWWVGYAEIVLWMVMTYFGAELADLSFPGVGDWAKRLAAKRDQV